MHDLFENEVEGKIVDPKIVHELFMDDSVHEQMDQMLPVEEPSFLSRFFRKFVGC